MDQKVFITADQHFGHDGVRSFCRPHFRNNGAHTEALISAWCARVQQHDLVYVLGDFAWQCDQLNVIFARLPGQLYLIKGNHDRRPIQKHRRWIWVRDVYKIKRDNINVWLCHYPIEDWPGRLGRQSYHFHGHSHNDAAGHMTTIPGRMDVGVDTRSDWGPWELGEAIAHVDKRDKQLPLAPSAR